MSDKFGLGYIVGAGTVGLIFFTADCNFNPPKLHDRENKIVRWEDQLYQMVPVEKKIEYVKPEEKK